MKITFSSLLFIFFSLNFYGQQLDYKKKFIGYDYYYNGKEINSTSLNNLLLQNQEAHKLWKSRKGLRTIKGIFSIGSLLSGFAIGSRLVQNLQIPKELLIFGVGTSLGELIFHRAAQKKLESSFRIFNESHVLKEKSLSLSSSPFVTEFKPTKQLAFGLQVKINLN